MGYIFLQDLNYQLKAVKQELDSKLNVDFEEITEMHNKNAKLKAALDTLQQDFRYQQETNEKDLDRIREENKILLTKIKTIETQVALANAIN